MSTLASQFQGAAAEVSKEFAGSTDGVAEGNLLLGPLDVQLYDRYTVYIKAESNALSDVKVWTSPTGVSDWVADSSDLSDGVAQGVTKLISMKDKSYKYIKVCVYHAQGVTVSGWFSAGGLT